MITFTRSLLVLLLLSFVAPSFAAEKAPGKKKASASEDAPKKASGTEEKKASAEAQKAADSLTSAQATKLLDILNKGDEAALTSLPGIGKTRAAAVVKGRPFKAPIDLLGVEGVGDGTFEEIVAHAKAGFPGAAAEKKPAAPAKGKKKAGTSKSKAKAKDGDKTKE